MIRIQPSWLLEAAGGRDVFESIYFPFLPRFSSANWFLRNGINLEINTPTDSQAMLFRSWLKGAETFSEKNTRKFNQIIKNPLDLEMNPFKTLKDKYFSRQQIDYLFYWREAAFEIEDESQREIFWGIVYQIISCWLSNRSAKIENSIPPDQLMAMILGYHGSFVKGRTGKAEIFCNNYEAVDSTKSNVVVFPLVFTEEDNIETEIQQVFHAWFHGHADLEKSRKDIRIDQRKFLYNIGGENEYQLMLRTSANAQICAVLWSGADLPPSLYEQQVVEPIKKVFSEKFSRSRLYLKAVDHTSDRFDFLLLFLS